MSSRRPLMLLLSLLVLIGCDEVQLGRSAQLEIYTVDDLTAELDAIWLQGDEGWIVGPEPAEEGAALVLSYDGTDWSVIDGPAGDLRDVLGDGAGGCWAVGDEGLAVFYDGTDWTRYTNLTYSDLAGLDGSGGVLWAVGDAGTVLVYSGGAWELLDPPTDLDLSAVAATDDGCVVVGAEGTILRSSGGEWSDESVAGVETNLRDIQLFEDGGVIVGDEGTILSWDGSAWQPLESPTNADLYGVGGYTPTNFLAAGADGTVVSAAGDTLRRLESPADETLLAARLESLSAGWVTGVGGVILHFH